MEIKNPRRILALGAADSGVLQLLSALTGSAPEPSTGSTAGLTHEWLLETKYYTTTLPIWVDEIDNVAEWHTAFTAPEAKEVITAIGAWVYCFRRPVTQTDLSTIKQTIRAIADAIKNACGLSGDQVCLAVAMPQSTVPYLDMSSDDWDEICSDTEFQYIDFEETGKNEFGEKLGIHRVRESLEACEWDSAEGMDFGYDGDDMEDFGSFADEEAEMDKELFDMALHRLDGEEEEEAAGEPSAEQAKEVEELEVIMRKMMAVKEMGESMGEAERKRFATKAISNLLKDL